MATIDTLLNAALSDRAGMMARMLGRLDIDLVEAGRVAQGTALADAARICIACRRTEECHAYLTGLPRHGYDALSRFCPNAGTFAILPRRGA